MSLLVQMPPSSLIDLLDLPCEDVAITANRDFFVGAHQNAILTVKEGASLQFRDIIVLGSLTIQSFGLAGLSINSTLVARNIFVAGKLNADKVDITCDNAEVFKNAKNFRQELQSIVIEWLDSQRECARNIGLRSLLV